MTTVPVFALPVALAALCALVGAVLGWWPLAGWARRTMKSQRMPQRTIRITVAVSTGLVWGLLALRLGPAAVLPAALAFAAASSVLAVVDLAEKRLPNAVIVPLLAAVAVLLLAASALTGTWSRMLAALIGCAAMFLLFVLLTLVAPRSLGMGDVKLAAPVGLLLGWFGLGAWLLGLVAGAVIGGVVAVIALASRRVTLRGSVAFGPAMLAGAVLAVLVVGGTGL